MFQQRDAQAFALGAARAVVGLFGQQVALDLVGAQMPEHHAHARQRALLKAAFPTPNRQRGLKDHGFAAHARELSQCALVVARLAQRLAVQVGHLVAADHDRIRVALRDRRRFLPRQAQGHVGWRFVWERGFIHLGAHGLKRQAQAREQGVAVG